MDSGENISDSDSVGTWTQDHEVFPQNQDIPSAQNILKITPHISFPTGKTGSGVSLILQVWGMGNVFCSFFCKQVYETIPGWYDTSIKSSLRMNAMNKDTSDSWTKLGITTEAIGWSSPLSPYYAEWESSEALTFHQAPYQAPYLEKYNENDSGMFQYILSLDLGNIAKYTEAVLSEGQNAEVTLYEGYKNTDMLDWIVIYLSDLDKNFSKNGSLFLFSIGVPRDTQKIESIRFFDKEGKEITYEKRIDVGSALSGETPSNILSCTNMRNRENQLQNCDIGLSGEALENIERIEVKFANLD